MGIADLLSSPADQDTDSANSGGNSGANSGGVLGDLEADPTPGRKRRPAKKTAAPSRAPATRRVSGARADVAKEIAAELEMYLGMVAMTVTVRDEVCGPALNAQAKEMAQAYAVLISRSERLMELMHGGGWLADVVGAAMATWPFIQAVRAHHTGHRGEDQDGGTDGLAAYPAFRPAA